MTVRLKDIAQELGVSTVTVSKVLRGNSDVGPATRERVLKRMQELDYKPNMLARGLASGRTFAVGLVVPDLVHPFFAELAKSIAAVLRTQDLALLLASSEENPEQETEEIRALLRRGVDTLLLASCNEKLRRSPELEEAAVPLILLDRRFPRIDASFVGSDDVRAGELATEHLLSLGRRRIAHIGGKHTSPSIDRAHGYHSTLKRHKLSVPDAYFVPREGVEESGDTVGFHAMEQLLRMRPRPDAVFCYNDLTAIGAIDAVLKAGLRVPQDVAIIGCGNLRYAPYLRVPLSSIDQNTSALGRHAGELALAAGKRRRAKQKLQNIILEPSLVVRASTQA